MVSTGAEIGGEMSGHIFLPYYWYDFDDPFAAGAVLLQIIAKAGVSLDDIKSFIPAAYSTHEIIWPVNNPDKKFELIETFIKQLDYSDVEINTMDGVRLTFKDSWAVIRASNTTCALTLRFSASTQARLQEIKVQVEQKLKSIQAILDN